MNKNNNKIITGLEKIDGILSGGLRAGEIYAIVGLPNRRPVMKYPEGVIEITLEMGEIPKKKIDAITKTAKI